MIPFDGKAGFPSVLGTQVFSARSGLIVIGRGFSFLPSPMAVRIKFVRVLIFPSALEKKFLLVCFSFFFGYSVGLSGEEYFGFVFALMHVPLIGGTPSFVPCSNFFPFFFRIG